MMRGANGKANGAISKAIGGAVFGFATLTAIYPAHSNDPQKGDDAGYEALLKVARVTSKTINPAGCLITAEANFIEFQEHIAAFREAWLNRDNSVDFYRQRRKQVFVFAVLKRFAGLITEGLYEEKQPPLTADCSFAISALFADNFGQMKSMPAVTWKFSQQRYKQVNWNNFDPRDFHEVAIDYKIGPEAHEWMSDEPSMASSAPRPTEQCDPLMFRANAIFVRATAFCPKNYMDSPAGYLALAGAKRCASSGADEDKLKAAMLEVDEVAKKRGRQRACAFVESIARMVTSKAR